MNNFILQFKNDLDKLISDLKKQSLIISFNESNINIDYSSKSKKGDLSTNIYLVLSKIITKKDFDLKIYILNFLMKLEYIAKVDFAKAGFINIIIEKKFLISNLINFYNNNFKLENDNIHKKSINIEFISANPTGPLHLAHIRGAVLGDVLSSILETVGHKVTREYYVNDSGAQIKSLGVSLFKRYKELFNEEIIFSENEYPGEYLIDIATKIKDLDGDKWIDTTNDQEKVLYFEKFAVDALIELIKNDLKLININFDKFSFESDIIKNKFIDEVFGILKKNDLIYEGLLKKPLGEENIDWEPRKQLLFRSTKFQDDSDRPFKKADGSWTYFANDSAYHYEKFTRGFDSLINIWGADHIGYISRMKSVVEVISNKKNYLEIFVCQIVRLIKNGKLLKMSKREGNFVTLKDIHKDVGIDALRYFMVSTKSETPMDFDINKVIEKNKDNPVFYCQYAYARASSVIKKSKEINIIAIESKFNSHYISDHEWDIILKILSWPYILMQAAEYKQPHRITIFLEDICSTFHSFWNKGKDNKSLRMIDEENIEKTITTLIWIESFRVVLKHAFDIIGINSPEQM